MNRDVYVCFVDFEKAFDRVQHSKMFKALNDIGIECSNVRAIASLFWQQVATVLLDSEETNVVQIKRGARHDCVCPRPFLISTQRK